MPQCLEPLRHDIPAAMSPTRQWPSDNPLGHNPPTFHTVERKSMRPNSRFPFLVAAVVVSGLLWSGLSGFAQAPQTYKARLSVVPIAGAAGRSNIDESATVFASANATASLSGTKLTVTGSFEGFKAPASIAQIRTGPAMGIRGPVVFELTITKATKGTL